MFFGTRFIYIGVFVCLKFNPRCAQPNTKQTLLTNSELITEADRIKSRIDSFQGWNGTKTPIELAIAGFRYTGISDKVICDSCGMKFYHWVETDNAVKSHKQYSPGCSFIKKWFTPEENPTESPGAESLLPPPTYPHFSSYQERLGSFAGWPCTHAYQSPSCMAQHGFFYTGSADRATCFQCGLRLRDWDESDYPAECHKEWSPNCPFIHQSNVNGLTEEQSSEATINDSENQPEEVPVQGAQVDTTSAPTNSPTEATSIVQQTEDASREDQDDRNSAGGLCNTASGSSADHAGHGHAESAVNACKTMADDASHVNWSSPKIKAVLEMGCEKEIIERVTREHLRNTGNDFPNAVSLMDAIIGVESSAI